MFAWSTALAYIGSDGKPLTNEASRAARSFGFAYDLGNFCVLLATDMAQLAQLILMHREQKPMWIYKVSHTSSSSE